MPVNPTLSEDHVNADAFDAEPTTNPAAGATVLSGRGSDRPSDASTEGMADGAKLVDVDFYNAQDGTAGRLGGVYLDMAERHEAEGYRAQSEGREPDFDNPPASTGTRLVPKDQLVNNTFSNPSSGTVDPVKEVEPVSTLPVDVGIPTNVTDTAQLEQELAEAQAANESATNEPTGDTAETGAQPENPDGVSSTATPTQTGTTETGSTYGNTTTTTL